MNAVSTLDDRTAAAIREAVRAASFGRLHEAAEIGERALASGGDAVALNAMIGSFRCRAGDYAAGIRHLRAAQSRRPTDPIITANLAEALTQNGEYAAVLGLLTEELARSDPSMRLERLRGFGAQMAEDFEAAIASYERVVAAEPADWESWNNLGNSRRLAGEFEGSIAALQRAAELNPQSAPVRLNLAMALNAAGRVAEGELALRRLAEDLPNDPRPLRELHLVLKELGREEEALDALEEAVKREPDDLELLLAVASSRLMLMRTEPAEAAYRKAIALDPSNGVANLGLAVTFELTNRAAELSRLVGEAEQRGVGPDALNFIRAYDLRRSAKFAEGLAAIAKVDDQLESIRRSHLTGQLHDGAGNYDQAFDAFSSMNELQLANPSRPEERAGWYRESVRVKLQAITDEWWRGWREEEAADQDWVPTFLVGFPRSGTTLLDTMLMGHPNIEVLEEEPTVNAAEDLLPAISELPKVDDEGIRRARDAYLATAAALVPIRPGNLLVDKNPLSMNQIPIIRRLFPGARIIVAIRHPCDVLLSCFTTNFKVNEGMSSFLRLETAAELYDLSFRYFERAQELFQLPMHTVRYEKVVEDRERELRSLIEFLGVEWRDEVLDHESTARARGRIKTASYAQVGQPIYKQSTGRWENYRKHLEPIIPVLEPWVRKFGYSL